MPRLFIASALFTVLLFTRCRDADPVPDAFRHATRIKIFSHNTSTDTLVFSSENQDEITRFIGYISGSGSEAYQCGFKGLMVLDYPNKPSSMLEFNTDEECAQIVFTSQDRIFYRHLTTEGLVRLRRMVIE